MKGRKPKPTKLKLLQGNPGHRPLNTNEPEPKQVEEVPVAPLHFSVSEKAEWDRVVPELHHTGILTKIDLSMLERYCVAHARWHDAKEALKKSTMLIKTKDGNIIQNPLIGIMNTAGKIADRISVEFGMGPSSRSRVIVAPKEKPKSSTWEGFNG